MRQRLMLLVACLAGMCLCLCGSVYAQDDEQHIYDSSEQYFTPADTALWQGSRLAGASLDNAVSKWKKDDDFEYMSQMEDFTRYVDSLIRVQRSKGTPLPSAREAFDAAAGNKGADHSRWFFMAAVVAFVVVVLYFMISGELGFFARPPQEEAAPVITVDDMGEHIWGLPYQELLPKALAENNYRLAVRILFLQTLTILDKKELIRFQPDLTNYDYLLQLRPADCYRQFALITRHYEHVWYGKFELTRDMYEKISSDFITLQSALES